MACPIPPLAPRCVTARRKDVRLVLCAILRGLPVAAWRLLRKPAWHTAAPSPAGPPPPPPDEGAGRRTSPPKGIAPSCYSPPPLNWQTPLTPPPPPHPGKPLVMAATAVPHPPCSLHDLHVGALCSSHRVCIGRRGCPISFLPTRCALFCGGEGGEKLPWLPRHGPLGGGGGGLV